MKKHHHETHLIHRISWLRASVLGANDGIISTSSLILGVAQASSSKEQVAIAALAGLVAGAFSMAAGEYVSVSSQADLEQSEIAKEKKELEHNHEHELKELTDIYIDRGVEKDLAHQVAIQLMDHDALKAHTRDELGINEAVAARPFQAALSSALSFSLGAALPLAVVMLTHTTEQLLVGVPITSLIFLGGLGALSARIGEAKKLKSILRVIFWGSAAMAITALIGHLLGAHQI